MVKFSDLLVDKSMHTDRAQTGLTSFGHQFDFHDVIYLIQPCNVDNKQRDVVFTTDGRSKRIKYVRKICIPVQTRVTVNSNTQLKMGESLYTLKDSF